jgi:hypothetical protein
MLWWFDTSVCMPLYANVTQLNSEGIQGCSTPGYGIVSIADVCHIFVNCTDSITVSGPHMAVVTSQCNVIMKSL